MASLWNGHALLTAIGVLTTTYVVYKTSGFINLYFIQRSKIPLYAQQNPDGRKSWALVTGASDGIGLGTSRELLSRGFSVLLHGRNQEKLARICSALQSEFPSQTVAYVVADAQGLETAVDTVVEAVKGTIMRKYHGQLRVLINNVGGANVGLRPGTPYILRLVEMLPSHMHAIVDVNILFPTLLTHAIINEFYVPDAKAQDSQDAPRKNLIVNVGSIAALLGSPFAAVYSGTKAFTSTFTRSLAAEIDDMSMSRYIEILGIYVGGVESGSNNLKANGVHISSAEMGRSIIDRVGCGQTMVVGSWKHALPGWIATQIPEKWTNKLIIQTMKQLRDMERKGQ